MRGGRSGCSNNAPSADGCRCVEACRNERAQSYLRGEIEGWRQRCFAAEAALSREQATSPTRLAAEAAHANANGKHVEAINSKLQVRAALAGCTVGTLRTSRPFFTTQLGAAGQKHYVQCSSTYPLGPFPS